MLESKQQPINHEEEGKSESRLSRLFIAPLRNVVTSADSMTLRRVLGLLKKAPEMEEFVKKDEPVTEEFAKQVVTVLDEEVFVDTNNNLVSEEDLDSKKSMSEVVQPPEQDKPVEVLISESFLEKTQEKGKKLFASGLINQEQLTRLIRVTENVIGKSDQDLNSLLSDLPISLVKEVNLLKKLQLSIQKTHFMDGILNTLDEKTGKFPKHMINSVISMEEFPLLESSQSYIDDEEFKASLITSHSLDSFMTAAYTHPDFISEQLSLFLQDESQLDSINQDKIYKILPLLAEGEQFEDFLPKEYIDFYNNLQDANVSVSMYEQVSTVLADNFILPPLPEDISDNLVNLLGDEILMHELSAQGSPYLDFIPLILLDATQIDILKTKISKSEVSFISAMKTHTLDKLDNGNLLDGIESTSNSLETPINSDKLTKEAIISRLTAVYSDSQNHTAKSSAVENFQDGQSSQLLIRSSAVEHLNFILEKGCYSQEYLPFIPGIQGNAMLGFLNSLKMEGKNDEVIASIANNEDLIAYGGDNPCVIIMAPSKETEVVTGQHIGKMAIGEGHGLTLVGVPSTEIAALLIQNSDSIAKTKQSLIEQEKYIPIYDSNENLVFSESEFEDALVAKKFQNFDQYLSNPPIIHLVEQSDGHMHGNLLEHTNRVIENTGIYKLNSRYGELSKIAASLHDIGKHSEETGDQSTKNITIAQPILNEIRGLSLADKQLIIKAISLDEKIGSLIQNFPIDSDLKQINETKEAFSQLFENEEELLFCLDLYLADVSGIGSGEEAKNWQVEEKLIKLDLHFTNISNK